MTEAETGVAEQPETFAGDATYDCRGPGRYEAGKEGSYRPCCPGLREVFYTKAAQGQDGAKVCISPPLRVYACVEGRCGDGVCEAGEAEACGCVADCPSAAWGDVATGEVGGGTSIVEPASDAAPSLDGGTESADGGDGSLAEGP